MIRSWLTRLTSSGTMLVGLLFTLLIWFLYIVNPNIFHPFELLASDLRFRLRGPRAAGPEVVIAAVDEKSIDQLGRWPWPLTIQAHLIERLTEYGAGAIGYDMVFSSSDTSAGVDKLRAIKKKLQVARQPLDEELVTFIDQALLEADHDRIFADALRRSKRAVLGYFFHFAKDEVAHLEEREIAASLAHIRHCKYNAVAKQEGVSLRDIPLSSAWAVEANLPILSTAAACGFFSNIADRDGAFRRYPLIVKYRQQIEQPGQQDYLFAPLAIRVLEQYVGANTLFWINHGGVQKVGIAGRQNYRIPTDRQGNLLINHLGPKGAFPYYSIVDILKRRASAPPAAFRNKIVMIGATATGLEDLRVTPFDPVLPGVELHAAVIDNVLRQSFLVQPRWARDYTALLIGIAGILLTLGLPRYGAVWGAIVTGGLVMTSFLANYLAFLIYGLWLDMVAPIVAIFWVAAGLTVYRYAVEEKDKRFLRKTFATYLSPALIEQMVATKTEPRLGGESGPRTAYFTDIASFSSFSEVLSPGQLVELINEYLSAMTDILLAEGGTLDKYEGDAILAFFGAPIYMPDHASRAVRTALGMQQMLAELRQKWRGEGRKWPPLVHNMRMRIGMSSGEFVTGNMGSTTRMDYTMMGDVVNTAARLESSAKQYGIYIQCTRETINMARPDMFEWRPIDKVQVVGKAEPIETAEIMALKGQLPDEQVRMCELFQQGLTLYHQQNWDAALKKFTESAALEEMFPTRPTNPSRVYLERCSLFKENPPGADWDGTWVLTSK